MTMRISKEVEFDTGHRVPHHGGKCAHPHGHRYRLRVWVEGHVHVDTGSTVDGMVVDFADLKAWATQVHDLLDHGSLVAHDDAQYRLALGVPTGYRLPPGVDLVANVPTTTGWKVAVIAAAPTAENIAVWAYGFLAPLVAANWPGCRVAAVDLWETPTSMVTYTGEVDVSTFGECAPGPSIGGHAAPAEGGVASGDTLDPDVARASAIMSGFTIPAGSDRFA